MANDITRLALHCGWSASMTIKKSYYESKYKIMINKNNNEPLINHDSSKVTNIFITNMFIVFKYHQKYFTFDIMVFQYIKL